MQAYLSDRMLFIEVMLVTLPAVIVLVVWSSLSMHITETPFQNEVGELLYLLAWFILILL